MCDHQTLRSACAYACAQSDQGLCKSFEYSMTVKLLTEQHLELLSLKRGCTGSSDSTLVKMPYCWKSHVAAHIADETTTVYSKLGNTCLPAMQAMHLKMYQSVSVVVRAASRPNLDAPSKNSNQPRNKSFRCPSADNVDCFAIKLRGLR